MSADRMDEIEAIFHEAIQIESMAGRRAYLDEACRHDPQLRTELGNLLEAHDAASGFLEEPVTRVTSDSPTRTVCAPEQDCEASLTGQNIGPWKLVRRIASGGMGTVYLAERADGQYKRQAAVKLLRGSPGLDDPKRRKEMIRRFREEQQHLARLDHPNFARLLDAGTTSDATPYIVMEYVDGKPITEYCDSHFLTIHERLALFRTVALAIEHAHRNLIAHRDLKPGNILVTSETKDVHGPTPKLVDFGIAKLMSESRYGREAAITGTGFHPMTPEYASPEQVRGEPTTALSDVYSLGIVLYELITGQMPYTVGEFDAKQIICEQAPTRPRQIKPGLNRDIESIILRAIEKDPNRRYQSAAQFADDIDRYLSGRAIVARPPSALYLFEKFLIRRWRSIAMVALFLAAGIWVGTRFSKASLDWKAQQWDSEQWKTAMAESSIAKELYQMAEAPLPKELIETKLYIAAEALLSNALALEDGLTHDDAPQALWLTAETKRLRGNCLTQMERYAEAEPLLLESYRITHERFGDGHSRTELARNSLVTLYERWGKPERIGPFLLSASSTSQAEPASDDAEANSPMSPE